MIGLVRYISRRCRLMSVAGWDLEMDEQMCRRITLDLLDR